MLKMIIGAVLGAAAGYLYYRIIGCSTGACPLTSNPITSSIYGAGIGLLMTVGR